MTPDILSLLFTDNIDERFSDTKEKYLFIGGYSWNGSKIFIDVSNGTVNMCGKFDSEIILTWPSLEEYLLQEIKRLDSLFDYRGVKIDPDRPTIPGR